jgi:P-type Ca2+ transporter type 2C
VQEEVVPFSSATKLSCVVVRDGRTEGSLFKVLVKGGPEYVLAACTSYYNAAGTVCPLDKAVLSSVAAAVDAAASKGQRVVALAEHGALSQSDFPEGFQFEVEPFPNFPTDGLTFVACVAVSDPPRAGVLEAVQQFRGADIEVAMVSCKL